MGLGEIRLGEMGLGEMGQNPFYDMQIEQRKQRPSQKCFCPPEKNSFPLKCGWLHACHCGVSRDISHVT